jgi:inorganic pyrophosphatase
MNAHHSDRFFHPWHSLSYGDDVPREVQCVIEIQQGSKAKYELDKETGFLRLDRVLASHLRYPFHYGFIPQTYCDDKDPLDVLVLCSEPLVPLSIVEARVIGALKMVDCGEQDDKIIAVASGDPVYKAVQDLEQLDPDHRTAITFFFEEYKKPEGKVVHVEALLAKDAAQEIVTSSIELYKKTFKK